MTFQVGATTHVASDQSAAPDKSDKEVIYGAVGRRADVLSLFDNDPSKAKCFATLLLCHQIANQKYAADLLLGDFQRALRDDTGEQLKKMFKDGAKFAVQRREAPLVSALAESGADLSEFVVEAIAGRKAELVGWLCENGARIDMDVHHHDYALETIIVRGHTDTLHALLTHGAVKNMNWTSCLTYTWQTLPAQRHKVMEALFKHGLTIDHDDDDVHETLTRCIRGWDVESARQLLKHGANVDGDGFGERPIELAITSMNPDMIRLVRNYGASLDGLSENQMNAIWTACKRD